MGHEGRDNPRFLLESWLDLGEAIDEHPELRQLLFDGVTGLPTAPLLLPRIESLLQERGEVSVLCVNVVRFSHIEEIFGWQAFDNLMCVIAEVLEEIAGEALRDSDVIAELMNSGNAFVVVLSPPRTKPRIVPADRIALAARVETTLRERLVERIDSAIADKFGCYVGSATVSGDEGTRVERLVYDCLEEALADSNSRQAHDVAERAARLRSILSAEDVRTYLLPIFDLEDMTIVGYEALSRGPAGGEFERPDKLFGTAYDSDLVMRLERVCRKRALEMANDIPEGLLLFLNIEPEAVSDPQLRDLVTSSARPITPNRIVLQLDERNAIADFAAFRSTLDYVRTLGFAIAVDDASAGAGSLQCLADVQPEWVRVDMSLVRGCDGDYVRATLIDALTSYCGRVGAKLIAKGIETEGELATLKVAGVRYGQGFLLSPPVESPLPDEERAESEEEA